MQEYFRSYKFKNSLFISFIIYFLPIAIIVGNSIINILNFILVILFVYEILNNKNLLNNYHNYFKFLFLITIFFLINIIFSLNKLATLVSYLGFFAHFILMLVIIYCIDTNIKFAKNFFKITFVVIIFVGIDTLYQYYNGADIFGYQMDDSHGRRLSGPFGSEYVVGSYLSKFFFITLLFLKENKLKYLKVFLIISFLLIIILSNERAASIMFSFAKILYFIFNNEFSKKEKIMKVIIFLILIIGLFKFNNNLKQHFIDRTFEQLGITQTNKIPHYNFLDSQWGAHFLTSIEILKIIL